MAQSEAKVTLFTCDVGPCGKHSTAVDGEAPAGVLGTVQLPDGSSAEWYAHSPVHVGKAVKAVQAKAILATVSAEAPAAG